MPLLRGSMRRGSRPRAQKSAATVTDGAKTMFS